MEKALVITEAVSKQEAKAIYFALFKRRELLLDKMGANSSYLKGFVTGDKLLLCNKNI